MTNQNDVIEIDNFVEKEVEMGYYDNFLFEGNGEDKHFEGSCTRINYCSCNCHHCNVATWLP